MFSKDPLQGNKRVGNVLEAGQKGVDTCIGLVLPWGTLGDSVTCLDKLRTYAQWFEALRRRLEGD